MKKIIFTDNIPDNINIFYTDYYFNSDLKNAVYVDVEVNIKKNVKCWTDEIDNWHAELCAFGSKHVDDWWILPGTRLMTWTPPYPQPLIFSLSLLSEIEKIEGDDLYISNAPLEVIHFISEFSPNLILKYNKQNTPTLYAKQSKLVEIKKIIKLFLQASFNLFGKKENLDRSYELGTYTQITSLNTLYQSDDHFFGNKLDQLDSNLWLIHSHFPPKQNKPIHKYFNNKKRKHLIIQEMISHLDVIRILTINYRLKKQLKAIKEKIPTLKISQYQSKYFSYSFFNNLIENYSALIEIETLISINKIFKKVCLEKLLYPFEDKGLERALLRNCKEYNILSIGYAHAVTNEGHLYFRKRSNENGYSPRPNLLACTGPAAISWQIQVAKQPVEKLIEVGTKRFESLPTTTREFPLNTVKVLFLVGMAHELQKLSHWVEKDPNLFDAVELTIRKYPFGHIQEQNSYIEKIKGHQPGLIENNLSLIEQISLCDVAIFSSTSAGYEAILAGKIGIYCDLGHIFALNSIGERGNCDNIFQCHAGLDLKSILSQLSNISKNDYLEIVQKQINFAKSVYAPPNFELLYTIS